MFQRVLPLIFLLSCTVLAVAGEHFDSYYGDVVYSSLVGLSTYHSFTTGQRVKNDEYYLSVKSEWSSTRGTTLPFQYQEEGVTVGVGARRWVMDHHVFAGVSIGDGILGTHSGEFDFRAGGAGYNAWEHGKRYTDLYGELFYVSRGKDTYLDMRYRQGHTLHHDAEGRLWTYGVGQLWASGSGSNGTENRIETGVGLGYVFWGGTASANAELRVGDAFRGAIPHRTYFNPTIVVAGSF